MLGVQVALGADVAGQVLAGQLFRWVHFETRPFVQNGHDLARVVVHDGVRLPAPDQRHGERARVVLVRRARLDFFT